MAGTYLPGRGIRTVRGLRRRSWAVWGTYGFLAFVAIDLVHAPVALAAVVAMAPPMAFGVARKRQIQRYDRSQKEALQTMHAGSPARADQDLAALARKFRWPSFLGRLAGYNRSLALMRLGKHAEAIELLADVDRRGGVIGVDGAIAGTIGYLHALLGDVGLAETWLDEAKQRDAGLTHRTRFPYVMTEVAIALRSGHPAEARARFDRDWREMEETLKGERLRPLRLLRAFATAQASDVRNAGAVTPLLAGLEERIDELAYLWSAWPELDAFVQSYIV